MRIGVMLRHLKGQQGGIGTYTTEILKALFQYDSTNEYILMYKDEDMIDTFANHSNVTEVVLKTKNNLLWDQIAVPHTAKQLNIDVIYNPKLSVPLFTNAKTVFVLHGADWFVFPQNYTFIDRIYHAIFASLYCKRSDGIISVSNNATEEILKRISVPNKIHTIYHAADSRFQKITDATYLDSIRSQYNLPEHFILFVGQIYPMKNFGGILRAFNLIRSKIPHKLVVVGKPALKFKKELDLIDELDLTEDVIFPGWVPDEDLPAFYNNAELFLFPSLYEGFGIPLLEAMACGCPVVTSTSGSCPEVVGNAALLVDPYDINAIAGAVNTILNDKELKNNLVDAGLKRAKQFSWEKAAKQTLAVLQSVYSSEPGIKK